MIVINALVDQNESLQQLVLLKFTSKIRFYETNYIA